MTRKKANILVTAIVVAGVALALAAAWLQLGPKVLMFAQAEYYRFGDQVLMIAPGETRIYQFR